MFEFIKKLNKERKIRKEKCDFNKGYDWAAGALLRNETTPMHIQATYFNYMDSFAYGADAAIDTLCELGIVEDNRL